MRFDPLVKCLIEMIEGRLLIVGVEDGCSLGECAALLMIGCWESQLGIHSMQFLISQNSSSLGDVIDVINE